MITRIIKAQKYAPGVLPAMRAGGKAYKLRDGRTVPTMDAEDLGGAIDSAKAGRGQGTAEDDPGFRAHLITRAAAMGARQLIPASWAHEGSAKSAAAGPLAKSGPGISVDTPALDVVARSRSLTEGLTKLARQGRLAEAGRELGQLASAQEAVKADLPGRAEHYDQQAACASDPAAADGYRQLAKQARETVAGAAGHLAKAGLYARRAAEAIDPADRRAYEQLAAEQRRKAGV